MGQLVAADRTQERSSANLIKASGLRDWCPTTFSDPGSDLVRQKAASWSSKLTNEETCTMKDLNYQLGRLCRDNRDGGFSTQATRSRILDLIANQLKELGFRRMQPRSLKPKHVNALISH